MCHLCALNESAVQDRAAAPANSPALPPSVQSAGLHAVGPQLETENEVEFDFQEADAARADGSEATDQPAACLDADLANDTDMAIALAVDEVEDEEEDDEDDGVVDLVMPDGAEGLVRNMLKDQAALNQVHLHMLAAVM